MSWQIYPASALAQFVPEWDRLNAEGPASPLLSSAFVTPLLRHFGTGKEVLACLMAGNRATAMLLLKPHGRGVWETFQPSQAPLGVGVRGPGLDWPECLAALLPALPGMTTLVGITQQDPDLEARPADGARQTTIDYIRTARITITGSFDTYWSGRGKNLRQNLKKQRNRLEKDAVATRLEIITDAADVAQAVADYGRLESAGWKAKGGTAVHANNAQGRFYCEMLENFCRQGRGRIYRYWYDAQLAAMDLCVEGDDSIIVLKTTYDEQVARTTSPALLMRQEAVALLFAQAHLRRIEFYGKVLDWHMRWTDEIRTMYHVNVYRWRGLLLLRRLLSRRSRGDFDPTAAVTGPSAQYPTTPTIHRVKTHAPYSANHHATQRGAAPRPTHDVAGRIATAR